MARASEVGTSDHFFTVKTHLGNLLHPGDTAMGYDLTAAVFPDDQMDTGGLPEVILIRKSYPPKSRTKRRKWALKTLEKDNEDNSRRKNQADQDMRDMEDFQRVRGWAGGCGSLALQGGMSDPGLFRSWRRTPNCVPMSTSIGAATPPWPIPRWATMNGRRKFRWRK